MQGEKAISILSEHKVLYSELLERDVLLDFYLPKDVKSPDTMGLLLINDGQDLPKMPFSELLDDLYFYRKIKLLLSYY